MHKFAASLALVSLNVWITWRLFWIDYTIHMGSVEGAFIGIARYTRDHWPDLGWWPLWFCGMPYENTYQPLLHTLVAALSGLADLNAGRAYHMAIAAAYSLGPATLFLLCARLTGRFVPSFLVGLSYSLFSPSAVLMSGIRQDLESAFYGRRLHAIVLYGDGPHVAALTLIPVAILCLHHALHKRTLLWWLLAVSAMAAVMLTNIPGWIAMAMALAAYASAYCVSRSSWLMLGAIVVGACGACSLWMPWSTIGTLVANTSWMDAANDWPLRRVLGSLGLALAVWLGPWAMRRRGVPRHIHFAGIFLLISAAVVLLAEYFDIVLIPQSLRFHLTLEMAIIMAVIFAAAEFIPAAKPVRAVGVLLIALAAAAQIGNYRTFARSILEPVNLEGRSEYKVARWLEEHAAGARVLAPGSIAFWMNAFTDTPQVTGCCDQGVLMPVVKMAYYAIGSDDGAGDRAADLSIAWLQAFGAQYVVVSGANSTEVYKDFAHPRKFEGRLTEVWRDGDDVIYRIPQHAAGLAHVVHEDEVVRQVPENGVLIEPILPYVAAVEDTRRPVPLMLWHGSDAMTIRAPLRREELLSVQVPWHGGWSAWANGAPIAISRDALGFMVLHPGCEGDCVVSLAYSGSSSRTVVRWVVGTFTAIALLVWIWRRGRGRGWLGANDLMKP